MSVKVIISLNVIVPLKHPPSSSIPNAAVSLKVVAQFDTGVRVVPLRLTCGGGINMFAKCLLFLAAADKHYAMVSFLLPAHLQSRDFLAGSLFFFFVSVEQWNSCNCGERDCLIWNIPSNWNQCTPQRSVSTSLSPCV